MVDERGIIIDTVADEDDSDDAVSKTGDAGTGDVGYGGGRAAGEGTVDESPGYDYRFSLGYFIAALVSIAIALWCFLTLLQTGILAGILKVAGGIIASFYALCFLIAAFTDVLD